MMYAELPMENKELSLWRQTILPFLGLFTSVGTLLCCALPALLVTLGMGATLAGLVGAAPWITAISEYKNIVFLIAGSLITIAAIGLWRARGAPCPADPLKAKLCMRLRKFSWIILGLAIFLYIIGAFFAFVAVHVFY